MSPTSMPSPFAPRKKYSQPLLGAVQSTPAGRDARSICARNASGLPLCCGQSKLSGISGAQTRREAPGAKASMLRAKRALATGAAEVEIHRANSSIAPSVGSGSPGRSSRTRLALARHATFTDAYKSARNSSRTGMRLPSVKFQRGLLGTISGPIPRCSSQKLRSEKSLARCPEQPRTFCSEALAFFISQVQIAAAEPIALRERLRISRKLLGRRNEMTLPRLHTFIPSSSSLNRWLIVIAIGLVGSVFQEQVAAAQVSKDATLAQSGYGEHQIAAYDDVVRR